MNCVVQLEGYGNYVEHPGSSGRGNASRSNTCGKAVARDLDLGHGSCLPICDEHQRAMFAATWVDKNGTEWKWVPLIGNSLPKDPITKAADAGPSLMRAMVANAARKIPDLNDDEP